MTFGMIPCLISIKAITRKQERIKRVKQREITNGKSGETWKNTREKAEANNIPVNNSTPIACIPIFLRQYRHRPFKNKNENRGTRSYHART